MSCYISWLFQVMSHSKIHGKSNSYHCVSLCMLCKSADLTFLKKKKITPELDSLLSLGIKLAPPLLWKQHWGCSSFLGTILLLTLKFLLKKKKVAPQITCWTESLSVTVYYFTQSKLGYIIKHKFKTHRNTTHYH